MELPLSVQHSAIEGSSFGGAIREDKKSIFPMRQSIKEFSLVIVSVVSPHFPLAWGLFVFPMADVICFQWVDVVAWEFISIGITAVVLIVIWIKRGVLFLDFELIILSALSERAGLFATSFAYFESGSSPLYFLRYWEFLLGDWRRLYHFRHLP